MKTRPTPEKKADPRDELIRQRAYEQYEKRGKQEGNEADDWLQAEQEVLAAETSETSGISPLTF